jgi:5,10-methylenetetrahydromethanopterin reductase
MQVGFFFWPYAPDLCEQLGERADRYGYAMIGIADTPGNAMDPWVSATIVARASRRARIALCVTNLLTRHPAVTAAAIASLDQVSNGRSLLGIGAGHSGTRNVGLAKSNAKELAEGVTFIKTLLDGRPATLGAAAAHLPWVKRAPPVFLAASHPRPLQAPDRRWRIREFRPGRRQHPRIASAHPQGSQGRRPLAGGRRDLANRRARLQ